MFCLLCMLMSLMGNKFPSISILATTLNYIRIKARRFCPNMLILKILNILPDSPQPHGFCTLFFFLNKLCLILQILRNALTSPLSLWKNV